MTDITARLMYIGLSILAENPRGLRARELWEAILEREPGIEEDWEGASAGNTGAERTFRWSSARLVKAGWLYKTSGVWRVTGLGRHALYRWPDPSEFYREANRHYREWRFRKAGYEQVEALISNIPDGHWVSLTEIANQYDLPPDSLLRWLQGERPEGWYRVLDRHGRIPAEAHVSEDERETWLRLLNDDGIDLAQGRAEPLERIPGEELERPVTDLEAPDEDAPRRAWLVRDSEQAFRRVWSPTETCSLGEPRLRELVPGTSREAVRAAVDEDLIHLNAPERARLASELHLFLNAIRKDDIVVTNDGANVYLGVVTGDATFDNGYLYRKVRWHNRDRPLNFYDDLPSGLSARVRNPDAELINLTDFVADLLPLIGEGSTEIVSREVRLPDATAELADRLLVPEEWLAECVALLRERPQLIFYGPPGTGKTYLAQALAAHLTGDRPESVQLVQFHPAYSYEDFFEGYRPREGKDKTITFELVRGPLRRLAAAAKKRPGDPHVLIIDEINRGNLAKIFGELYFLLEYRDRGVNLMYGSDKDDLFTLPDNLFILGTMNTADRSIALVDAAMRRRFAFVELHPGEPPTSEMLARWLERENLPDEPARLLAELNRRIDDRDFRVGPSYLMRRSVDTNAGLERIWRTQILPLLEEFHYGDGTDVRREYGLKALRDAL
ncbi:hypothetical protein GCM10023085_37810 [Actinomadura viridis]